MSKLLIEEFKDEAAKHNLPLILHFASIYPMGGDSNASEVLKRPAALVQRYRTTRYLPSNKFFKPISKTLDV